jgi:hypothetical protein
MKTCYFQTYFIFGVSYFIINTNTCWELHSKRSPKKVIMNSNVSLIIFILFSGFFNNLLLSIIHPTYYILKVLHSQINPNLFLKACTLSFQLTEVFSSGLFLHSLPASPAQPASSPWNTNILSKSPFLPIEIPRNPHNF